MTIYIREMNTVSLGMTNFHFWFLFEFPWEDDIYIDVWCTNCWRGIQKKSELYFGISLSFGVREEAI